MAKEIYQGANLIQFIGIWMITGRALGIVIKMKESHNHLVSGPGHFGRINGLVVDGFGGPIGMSLIFFVKSHVYCEANKQFELLPNLHLSTQMDGHKRNGGCWQYTAGHTNLSGQ